MVEVNFIVGNERKMSHKLGPSARNEGVWEATSRANTGPRVKGKMTGYDQNENEWTSISLTTDDSRRSKRDMGEEK